MATYKKQLKDKDGNTIYPDVGLNLDDVVYADDPESVGDDYIDPASYSTTEHKTGGTWIDGKPLYRKVIKVNNPTLNSTFDQPHGISNFKIGFIKQMFVVRGNASREINYFYNTGEYCVSQINQTNISFRIPASTWSWGDIEYLIAIIEYTKTTD